jgi:hypothetical protein
VLEEAITKGILEGNNNASEEQIEIENIPYFSPNKGKEVVKSIEYNSSKKMNIVTFNDTPREDRLVEEEEVLDMEPLIKASPTPPSLPQPPRQSSRLKFKLSVQYVTGSPVTTLHQNRLPLLRAGIDSLVNQFSYPHFSNSEIVTMFTENGFSLGSNDKTRLKVVKYFRSLNKHQSSFVLNDILDRLDNNCSEIDLSTKLLPLGNLISP